MNRRTALKVIAAGMAGALLPNTTKARSVRGVYGAMRITYDGMCIPIGVLTRQQCVNDFARFALKKYPQLAEAKRAQIELWLYSTKDWVNARPDFTWRTEEGWANLQERFARYSWEVLDG